MKSIYEMIEQRASDLRMLATQTDIDYDSDDTLKLNEPKNHEHIVEDMRGRWDKVSELADEISTLVDIVREADMWRIRYECALKKTTPEMEIQRLREANEEIRRQQNRIEDR